MGGDRNRVKIVSKAGVEEWPDMSKVEVAAAAGRPGSVPRQDEAGCDLGGEGACPDTLIVYEAASPLSPRADHSLIHSETFLKMKLFYMPGACSLAPHWLRNEAGLDVEFIKVNSEQDRDQRGFLATNPNGYVPALVLADGELMTEASVLVQYLADQKPESGLMPKAGEMARYRVQQWLAFVATELHKAFGPFFRPDTPNATETNRAHLVKRLAYVDQKLEGRSYLMGDVFSAADASVDRARLGQEHRLQPRALRRRPALPRNGCRSSGGAEALRREEGLA